MKRLVFVGMLLASHFSFAGSVEFTVLGIGRPPNIPIGFIDQEGAFHRIPVQNIARSPLYRYKGEQPLELFTPGEVIEGEQTYRPIWQYPVQGKSTRILLLVSDGDDVPSFFVMDDSLETFDFGTYKYFNLTERQLVVLHDTEKFSLNPQEIKAIEPDTADRAKCAIQIVARHNEELILAFTTSNRHYEQARYLCFVTEYTPKKRAVRLRVITETPSEAKEFGDPVEETER
ncbi:MAG: hypothetical protein JJU05_04250 [Verrucomicrobia bacterium]|nr:hypothetical protein [Verrucomicrobiota bacterium]MCH8525543.1 hypothetical protein [Kiritimatiellia bacterium]